MKSFLSPLRNRHLILKGFIKYLRSSLNLTFFPAYAIIPAMNVETAFFQPAGSEISIIQGRQISELFTVNDLQGSAKPCGISWTFALLFVI